VYEHNPEFREPQGLVPRLDYWAKLLDLNAPNFVMTFDVKRRIAKVLAEARGCLTSS